MPTTIKPARPRGRPRIHKSLAPGAALQSPESVAALPVLAVRCEQAAKMLGISSRTLRDQFRDAPQVRRGATILYPVDALRRWLAENAAPNMAMPVTDDQTA